MNVYVSEPESGVGVGVVGVGVGVGVVCVWACVLCVRSNAGRQRANSPTSSVVLCSLSLSLPLGGTSINYWCKWRVKGRRQGFGCCCLVLFWSNKKSGRRVLARAHKREAEIAERKGREKERVD